MNKFVLTIGISVSCVCIPGFADSVAMGSAKDGSVAVEIDGSKITLGDIESKHPGSMFQARNSLYQAQKKAAEEYVDEYLLDREAKKEGLTVEELLKKHVDSTIAKDPSEDALHVYYEGVDTKEPYEAVRQKIIDSLRGVRITRAKAAYMKTLHDKANVAVVLQAPRAPVSLKDTPVRGDANAPVMLVEFADYECPSCQQVQPLLEKIEAEFKGKIAFAYKDLPLPQHPHAQKAAEAAHCAGNQGKYWEYHDMLFKTKELKVPQLKEHAQALKLDMQKFNKCLDSGEPAPMIKAALTEAATFQLPGTPSLFLNGRFIGGGMPLEQFKTVIEDELKASSKNAASASEPTNESARSAK